MLCPRGRFLRKIVAMVGYVSINSTTSSLYARVQHVAPKSAACMSVSRYNNTPYGYLFYVLLLINHGIPSDIHAARDICGDTD